MDNLSLGMSWLMHNKIRSIKATVSDSFNFSDIKRNSAHQFHIWPICPATNT